MTQQTVSSFIRWSYPGHPSAYISELFAAMEKAKTEEQRKKNLVDWMKVNANSRLKIKSLRVALECMFLPECKLDLPAGSPNNMDKFHKFPDQTSSSIFKVMGSIGYFLPKHPNFIPDPLKREKVFVQLAESMCESEAYLFFAIKDADPSFVQGLTHEFIHSVVPGWIPAPVASKVKAEVATEPKKVEPVATVTQTGLRLKKDGTPMGKPGPKPKSTEQPSVKN